MKVILYGLGKGLEYVESNLKEAHEIIGYSDSFATIKVFKGKPFYMLEQLPEISFDHLIITVKNRKESWKIYELLSNGPYKIAMAKVIPFYVYAKSEYWDICMNKADIKQAEGLIMGTSYARNGFLTNYLSVPFINLGVPSQDLFSELETFKAIIAKYGNKLQKLKYIVIDMFDYYYFNYDASLCKVFFSYLGYGGIIRKHHYDYNAWYKNEFEKELLIQLGIKRDRDITNILDELFEEHAALDFEVLAGERWKYINGDVPLPIGHFMAHIINKKDEGVIANNRRYLEELLEVIHNFNPDIKIVLVLMPKYISLEKTKEITLGQWKDDFDKIIEEICKRENVYFKNYKFCTGIYDNNHFWYDIDHLNTAGARCLTSIFDEDMKKELY